NQRGETEQACGIIMHFQSPPFRTDPSWAEHPAPSVFSASLQIEQRAILPGLRAQVLIGRGNPGAQMRRRMPRPTRIVEDRGGKRAMTMRLASLRLPTSSGLNRRDVMGDSRYRKVTAPS